MNKDIVRKVIELDHDGVCCGVDYLRDLGFDCRSYYKAINEADDDNFDEVNLEARDNLYKELGIYEDFIRDYENY